MGEDDDALARLDRLMMADWDGRPTHYDRQGKPIRHFMDWGRLRQDRDYCVVKQEVVGPYWISTVWVGYNMALMPGRLAIFETMVFPRDGDQIDAGHDFDMARYATEEEAIAGHEAMVSIVRATLLDVPDTLEEE